MVHGDQSLIVTGVVHIATKNNVTVRVRIFLKDAKGEGYSFDADALTFELQKLKCAHEDIRILGGACTWVKQSR